MRTAIAGAMVLVLCAASTAHAMCRDDVAAFGERVQKVAMTGGDAAGVAIARKETAKAMAAEPFSEVDCLNALAKARKALAAPASAPPAGSGLQ